MVLSWKKRDHSCYGSMVSSNSTIKLVKVLNKILRVYLAVAGLGVVLNVLF